MSKQIYHTDEERKQAKREADRRYKSNHKDDIEFLTIRRATDKRAYDKRKDKAEFKQAHNERSQRWYFANTEQALSTRKGYRESHRENFRRYSVAFNKSSKGQASTAAKNARRRASFKDILVEVIVPRDIFVRDGWICQLCLAPVDETLTYPHPMSASMDHIIPISLRGNHISSNVQLAHLRCNLRKGARVPNTSL